jgi:RNA polymerase sigma-70 factor (ECF subfamily)
VSPDLQPEQLGEHLDRLYRAAWALCGSREDAEDLVQETCASVLKKRRRLRHADDALPYLLGVLRNTYVSTWRTRARRPATTTLDESMEATLSAPASTRPDAITSANEVFGAIAELPQDFRDVVVCTDVVGLSYAETAGALGVPAGTLMSRLYRARERLIARLAAPT